MVQWPGGQRSCEVWTGGSIFAEMSCCKIHPGNLLNWKQGARMCPKISWLIMVDDHFPMVSQNWLKGWRQELDVSPCLTSVFGAKQQASFREFEFSQRNRSIESLHSIYSMRWFQSVSNPIFSYIFIYFPIFSQYFPNMFPIFSQYFPNIFPIFSPYFPNIFPIFSQYFPYIFPMSLWSGWRPQPARFRSCQPMGSATRIGSAPARTPTVSSPPGASEISGTPDVGDPGPEKPWPSGSRGW